MARALAEFQSRAAKVPVAVILLAQKAGIAAARPALGLAMLVACSPERNDPPPSEVVAPRGDDSGEREIVARIGERLIRLDELDAWVKDRLFRQNAESAPDGIQGYRARQLAEMIDELLLSEEAAREGRSLEEFLAEEVPGGISDEDIRAFQEQNPLSDFLPETHLRHVLETTQGREARRAYLDDLSERAGVRIEPAYRVDRTGSAPDLFRNPTAEPGSGFR